MGHQEKKRLAVGAAETTEAAESTATAVFWHQPSQLSQQSQPPPRSCLIALTIAIN